MLENVVVGCVLVVAGVFVWRMVSNDNRMIRDYNEMLGCRRQGILQKMIDVLSVKK
jgi:hypothetical protein